jgi:hypothetical protein
MIFYLLVLFLLYYLYIINKIYYENFNSDNEKFTAIIIEPRKHKALELVLNNFMENLDTKWNIIIFHGIDNEEYIKDIIKTNNKLQNNRLKMIKLNVHNLSIVDYNKLLLSKSFYDYISTEIFLVFQTDTLICKKHKDLIYNFIKYDYVGAPWISDEWNANKLTYNVGNGGLSLRRKSKMLELLDNCYYNDYTVEDHFFFNLFGYCNIDVNKPDENEAKYFAIEQIDNDKSWVVTSRH